MKRLLLVLAAAALAVAVVEGVYSLGFDRSLVRRALEGRASQPVAPTPREGPGGPADALGIYRVHPDPRVAYVLRPDAELAIFEGRIHSDELGLRRRPLPPRGPDALRIVVLGDSVAFGYGLDDDETLANRLELLLNAAGEAAGVAGGAPARPVECRTVAIPGWNHRNAVWCLLDHLEALDPDLVLYLPIANDMLDSDGVDENGNRRWTIDAASREPWLSVNQLASIAFAVQAMDAVKAEGKVAWSWLGPDAILADLSPGSDRRYDDNLDSIRLLERTLARRDGKLLLLQYQDDEYMRHLRRRFIEEGLDPPLLPLFDIVPEALTLGFDPHPAAATIEAVARWAAADLLARGWVAGDPAAIPAVPDAIAAHREPTRTRAEVYQRSAALRWESWARLQPAIDLATYLGVRQAIGGLNADGSAGARALFLLPRGGPELVVRLAGVPSRPDLYPMSVAVEIDDRPAGSVRLEGEGVVEARFDVPPQPAPAAPIEVRLIPERYGAVRLRDVGWQLVSFRPLRLQCGTPPADGALPDVPVPAAGTPYPMR